MLNILPLSILQAWGLWRDFDGVHGDTQHDETVFEVNESGRALANNWEHI